MGAARAVGFEVAANGSKYSKPARILHWISALIILWATISGVVLGLFAVPDAIKHPIVAFNVATTTLFIPLFLLRMLYALFARPPQPVKLKRWNMRAARWVHIAMYVVAATALFSGVLMMKKDIDLYGLAAIPHPLNDAHLHDLFFAVHKRACAVLAALIVVHIVAVIWHQRRGNNILARML